MLRMVGFAAMLLLSSFASAAGTYDGGNTVKKTGAQSMSGGLTNTSAAGLTVTVGSVTTPTAVFGLGIALSTMTSNIGFLTLVSSETITAAAVITANACGGTKIVYAEGAVTTNTTNTFTAPSAANAGCCMKVVADRVSANITLDANGNFDSAGGADVVLTAKDSVIVCQVGTYWSQISALLAK